MAKGRSTDMLNAGGVTLRSLSKSSSRCAKDNIRISLDSVCGEIDPDDRSRRLITQELHLVSLNKEPSQPQRVSRRRVPIGDSSQVIRQSNRWSSNRTQYRRKLLLANKWALWICWTAPCKIPKSRRVASNPRATLVNVLSDQSSLILPCTIQSL